MKAISSGVIIIGGGVVKHHICNANLMVHKNIMNLFITKSILFY
jgi:deoxyhypusine synthase